MKTRNILVATLTGTLLTSCLKDGIDPPNTAPGSSLELRFDLHCDGHPFSPDSLYADGFGTLVRIERFRLALAGATLLSDAGQPMGAWPDQVMLIDLTRQDRRFSLPNPSSGEAHWLESRMLQSAYRIPGADSLWFEDASGSYQAMLDIGGTMDSNDDGRIDSTDGRFRIVAAADPNDPALLIHAHASVPLNGSAVMMVPVNLRAVLHDIDLPDEPCTMGEGIYAAQALENLRARVLGDDNKPR